MMFSLSAFQTIGLRAKQFLVSLSLFLAFSLSVADSPQQDNPVPIKPVDEPSAESRLFDLGINYHVDSKHPSKAAFEVDINLLDRLDLCTLSLVFFNGTERRYEFVSHIRPNGDGVFEAPIDMDGPYSLVALPSLPYPVETVRQLCTLSDSPESPLSKKKLHEFCKNVYCPAFKNASLPNPFAAEPACERCFALQGRKPRDIAECGLLPFEENNDITPAGFGGVVSFKYKCRDVTEFTRGIAKIPRHIPDGSRLPMILYVHGDTGGHPEAYRGYNYVLERLAQHGFIAASIDTSGADLQGDNAAEVVLRTSKIKRHLDCWREGEMQIVEGDDYRAHLRDHIDFGNIGLAGHSQGGEAIVLAEIKNREQEWGYGIKAIHAIAPSDHHDLTIDGVPYMLLLGADDEDNGFGVDGLSVYDRAVPRAPKIQAFVYGAYHNSFNSTILTDATARRYQQVEQTLAVSFFRHFLNGFQPARVVWTRNALNSSSSNVQLFLSYQDPSFSMVDTFEPRKNALPDPLRNDLGGRNVIVTGRGPPDPATGEPLLSTVSPLEEVWLFSDRVPAFNSDQRFFHRTHGLKLGWKRPSEIVPPGRLELNIPTEYLNITAGKPFLAFRTAQHFDRNWNAPRQEQDFEIGVEDADGTQGYVKASDFARIPWPFERTDLRTKSVLQTVRLPLCAFKPKHESHKVDLDIGRIAKIVFRFNQRPRGLIAIDDIQFTE